MNLLNLQTANDTSNILGMLVASVERLKAEMSHPDEPPMKWDERKTTIFYLERNLKWAKEVLENEPTKSANG